MSDLVEAALTMLDDTGYVDGEDVARAVGGGPDATVYDAMREADRRGLLECQSWRGGTGLPNYVRRP